MRALLAAALIPVCSGAGGGAAATEAAAAVGAMVGAAVLAVLSVWLKRRLCPASRRWNSKRADEESHHRGVMLTSAPEEVAEEDAVDFRAPVRDIDGLVPGELKTFFSVFFLESNTDRNTRFFLAVAVAYFAYFGPYFRIGGGRGKLTAI